MATRALARLQPHVTRVAMTISCPDDVRNFVKECIPKLSSVPADDIHVSHLAGGLTNILYCASHEQSNVHAVVRQFGEGTEAFIDRDAEEFWIAAFMDVYGRCDNGLAYEFLVGYAPPSLEEYKARRSELATALAQFHHRGAMWGRCSPRYANAPNSAKHVFLGSFIESAVQVKDKDLSGFSEEDQASLHRLIEQLPKDAERLLRTIATFEHHLAVGPCHNDANTPNTLLHADTRQIRFIDFEYMQPSFLLADIANTMCEFAGYDGEWERMLTREEKCAFLRRYFEESARLTMGKGATVEGSMEAEVAMMDLLEGVSHVGWAAWAVAQAASSTIDYDFVAYAVRRQGRFASMIEDWEAQVHACVPDLKI
uniref:ethanolamine kinase n=1 Tax=Neobodo designis TaxID=312471 RepID=A0A7S1QTI2_NEODS|mmetsp:Transcript_51810/g.159655  ORF Transcript_51810/g.159655 Transcript_51810/m.159655 type:complete len:369 (+) Transcript_51810:47-1153(+)|eukprot:CAMPEP_0174849876 /NCGR_PEP_ID=MMETSP1114-20130205/17901_1 /TAXON_ID=312471 /ORGANISM="Neobodo designis, Strain CCAP 1951/1" /LENGTH=368 /DNA_ID=CAMNT_0016084285 /DNA_START=48 /DNA_END=1154 /DNA_ORIENTATION=-